MTILKRIIAKSFLLLLFTKNSHTKTFTPCMISMPHTYSYHVQYYKLFISGPPCVSASFYAAHCSTTTFEQNCATSSPTQGAAQESPSASCHLFSTARKISHPPRKLHHISSCTRWDVRCHWTLGRASWTRISDTRSGNLCGPRSSLPMLSLLVPLVRP